jgi:hypothetical protein
MEIRSFRDLDVWTMAMELVIECYRITSRYPREASCFTACNEVSK